MVINTSSSFSTSPLSTSCPPTGRQSERGVVLIWALASTLMIAGLIIAGTAEERAVNTMTRAEFSADGQAREIASAGLVDAFAWLRRQSAQPVATFAPALNPLASVPVNDTEDPGIGLVRTFEISPGLWGRYVVQHGVPAEPFVDADGNGHYDAGETYTDQDGNNQWTPGRGTRDISSERGMPGSGAVWYLESEGIVYNRPSANIPLGTAPNSVVGRTRLATEVRRMTINPPAAAAVCVGDADGVDFGQRSRVRAEGGTAIAYPQGSGSASTTDSEITGALSGIPDYDGAVENVFGMSWSELRSMADVSTDDPENGLPSKVADYSLVVIKGDVTFDSARPLKGLGVVIVQGDCTIEASSNSFFNGLLYVEGDLTVRAPAILSGQIIVNGGCDVRGTSGDFVEIEFDSGIVTLLLTRMGQYRYSKATFNPSRHLVDGRPSELHKSQRRLGTGYEVETHGN